MSQCPSPDPDEILERMVDDEESDWPDRLLDAMSDHRLVSEDKIDEQANHKMVNRMPLPMNVRLTEKEKLVLAYAARGLTTEETADAMCLSMETIKTHKVKILRLLRAKNTQHAIYIAAKAEII